MLHISLFSGIGGFDLASEWMGWKNIASCEINPFGRKILEYYWPNAYHHDDIKTLTYTKLNEELTKKHGADWRADNIVLTGGFPCQPYSTAGKRLGTEDERHLWPEMLRAIREIEPTYIVGENVRGLLNWNGGMVFHEVCSDLEALGYEVAPCIIPACGVNAPHKRERIFFVAKNTLFCRRVQREPWQKGTENGEQRNSSPRNTDWLCGTEVARPTTDTSSNGCKNGCSETIGEKRGGQQGRVQQLEGVGGERSTTNSECIGHTRRTQTSGNNNAERIGRMDTDSGRNGNEIRSEVERCGGNTCNADAKNTNGIGQKRGMHSDKSQNAIRKQFSESNARHNEWGTWQNFPTQSPICSRNDGLSAKLDGITFPRWRNEAIKAAGNAVVPPLILKIFQAIENTKNHL